MTYKNNFPIFYLRESNDLSNFLNCKYYTTHARRYKMAREVRESQTGSKLYIQTEASKTTIQFINVNLPLYRSIPINTAQYLFEVSIDYDNTYQ